MSNIAEQSLAGVLTKRLLKYRRNFPGFARDAQETLQRAIGEAIDSGDWNRIGAIVALLWYKLDRLIELSKEGNSVLKDIRREVKK